MTFETLLTNPAAQSLGWALLHFVWQGSLLAALFFVANALTHRSQATVRYATGCIVMLLMPAVFVATILRIELFQSRAKPAQDPGVVVIIGTDPEPAETAVLTSGGTVLPSDGASAWYKAAALPGGVVCVWLVGVLVLSMYTAGGWLRVQRLRRRVVAPADQAWLSTLDSLMRRLQVSWPVRLYASAIVQVPTVLGWLRPYILLPLSAITGLGEAQLQAVLAHELAHVRRCDYLVNLLQHAVETLLFYHPAVWWVSSRIREERERCCDDLAVAVCGDVMVYAGALARLEELRGSFSEPVLAATGGDLLARIRRLAGQESKDRDRIPGSVSATLVAALVLAVAIGVGEAPAMHAQSAAPPQAASAQSAGSPPVFEIASVKVNADPDRQRALGRLGQIQYSPDTLTMRGISLWMSTRWAYGVDNFQISGPDWMQDSPVYDIVAKAPGPVPASQLRLMLRTLLAERFHLTVHTERKELPVTALFVAKAGPTFHESAGKYDPARGAEAPMRFLGYDDSVHIQRTQEPDGRLRDSFTNVSMKLFAAVLELASSRSGYDGVPVVDMTGLQGRFDFVIARRPGSLGSEGEGASPDYPPLSPNDPLAAWKPILQKQLGLTLKRAKAMVDIILVDHVDKKPAPN